VVSLSPAGPISRTARNQPRAYSLTGPSGTRIGCEAYGEGPPLVLIHGAFSDHRTNWALIKPLLECHFTVHVIARRGRGSTDATVGHRLEDEAEDAAALIRQVGFPVFLLGHSYGAHVALGAARILPDRVRKLVLYEAPWPRLVDDAALVPLDALARSGDWDHFAATFFAEVLAMPQADLDAMRASNDWASIVADAPATLGDLRALARYRFDPESCRGLPMPVLLQAGSESPPDFYVTDALAAVLPDAAVGVLAGQAHEGMTTAPEQYADAVRNFLMTGGRLPSS